MNNCSSSAMFHEDVFLTYFEPCRPDSISEDEFIVDFWIQPSKAAFAELLRIDAQFVWTIVEDGFSRNIYYTPGFHVVNRVGYVITKQPHHFACIDFCGYRYRPFLTELGLRREIKRLKKFLLHDQKQAIKSG